jgi:hypothetical protein
MFPDILRCPIFTSKFTTPCEKILVSDKFLVGRYLSTEHNFINIYIFITNASRLVTLMGGTLLSLLYLHFLFYFTSVADPHPRSSASLCFFDPWIRIRDGKTSGSGIRKNPDPGLGRIWILDPGCPSRIVFPRA